MITAITLENFKGISTSVTVPIRPLTIMFGKNSAGKSTVIQALHFAREIFEHGLFLNHPKKKLYQTNTFDLGDFENLVHQRDLTKSIKMRFDLTFFEADNFYESCFYYDLEGIDLHRSIESASFDFEVKLNNWTGMTELANVATSINGIGITQCKNFNFSFDAVEINCNHPIFKNSTAKEKKESLNWKRIEVKRKNSTDMLGELKIINTSDSTELINDLALNQILISPIRELAEDLKWVRHIGALRSIPPRDFQPSGLNDEAGWSNGISAWNELMRSNTSLLQNRLIERTSDWLSSERLKTGYRIKLKRFCEVPTDIQFFLNSWLNAKDERKYKMVSKYVDEISKLPVKLKLVLINETTDMEVQPHDIGVGISQIIPIIVAALCSDDQLVSIEQPELHLHPAVQAELGDLFIQTSLGDSNNSFLLETHSEHLILRVLRRIRETTRGKAETAIRPEDVSLLFVGENNKQTEFLNLRIDKNGRIIDRVPGGFFEEDFAEIF